MQTDGSSEKFLDRAEVFLRDQEFPFIRMEAQILATIPTCVQDLSVRIAPLGGNDLGVSLQVLGIMPTFRAREETLEVLHYAGKVAPGKFQLGEEGRVRYVLDCLPRQQCGDFEFKACLDIAVSAVCSLYQSLVKCLVAGTSIEEAFGEKKVDVDPPKWLREIEDIVRSSKDRGVAVEAGIAPGPVPRHTKRCYAVVLTAATRDKSANINKVREITGLSLKDAKECVKRIPSKLAGGLTRRRAQSMVKELSGAGFRARVVVLEQ